MKSEVGLDKLAYQVWVLADLDLIEPAGDQDPQRGLPLRLTTSEGRRSSPWACLPLKSAAASQPTAGSRTVRRLIAAPEAGSKRP